VIFRIRVQCKGSSGGSWRFTGPARTLHEPGSLSTDEICALALKMARDHATENPDDDAKYRAHYSIRLRDGGEAPKYATIRAVWDESGLRFDDEEDTPDTTEREKVLAEALEDARQIARQSGVIALDAMKAYTESIATIGKQIENMAKGQAAVAEAMAAGQKATASALLEAGTLYREGQARTVEQDRIAAEMRMVERDMDASDKRMEMFAGLLPPVAFGVLARMGVPPDAAAKVVQVMGAMRGAGSEAEIMGGLAGGAAAITGGAGDAGTAAMAGMAGMAGGMPGGAGGGGHGPPPAGGAAQATPTPRAAGWEPPEIDLDTIPTARDGEGGALALACWFTERTPDEERALRKVVGPETYDAIRGSVAAGDRAAGDALRAFGVRVSGLGLSALQVLGQLRQAIGGEALTEFQDLVSKARTGGVGW